MIHPPNNLKFLSCYSLSNTEHLFCWWEFPIWPLYLCYTSSLTTWTGPRRPTVNSRVLEGVLIAGRSPTEVKTCSRPPHPNHMQVFEPLPAATLPACVHAWCRTAVSFSLSRCFTVKCTKHLNLQNHIFFLFVFCYYCRDLPSACNEEKVLRQYGNEC